jgi:hypothetical protein
VEELLIAKNADELFLRNAVWKQRNQTKSWKAELDLEADD